MIIYGALYGAHHFADFVSFKIRNAKLPAIKKSQTKSQSALSLHSRLTSNHSPPSAPHTSSDTIPPAESAPHAFPFAQSCLYLKR